MSLQLDWWMWTSFCQLDALTSISEEISKGEVMFLLLWLCKVCFWFFFPAVFQDADTSFLGVESPLRQWWLELLCTARKRGPWRHQVDTDSLTMGLPHLAQVDTPGQFWPAEHWAIPAEHWAIPAGTAWDHFSNSVSNDSVDTLF